MPERHRTRGRRQSEHPGFGATTEEALLWIMEKLDRQEEMIVALSDNIESALVDLKEDVSKVLDMFSGKVATMQTTIDTLTTQVQALTGDNTAALATIQELKDQTTSMETDLLTRIEDIDAALEEELPTEEPPVTEPPTP